MFDSQHFGKYSTETAGLSQKHCYVANNDCGGGEEA